MESWKEKIQKRSTFLAKRIFEPLQSRGPLDEMKLFLSKSSRKTFGFKKNALKGKKSLKAEKKLNFSIIGLPKLPFGKHNNYNHVSIFSRNQNFFDSPEKSLKISLKNKIKGKKISLTRESSPLVRGMRGNSLNSAKFQELSGSGGKLFIEIDAFGVHNYNAEKMKYGSLLSSISK